MHEVIEKVYHKGGIFDAWGEHFHNEYWMESLEECGLDPLFYTTRERSFEELFPWDFIDCGVSKEFLKREWLQALSEKETPNCRAACQGCGAARFQTGICLEHGMQQNSVPEV